MSEIIDDLQEVIREQRVELKTQKQKVEEMSSLMSELFGDGYYGENPKLDRVFDLLDDLCGRTGKDRCDYVE